MFKHLSLKSVFFFIMLLTGFLRLQAQDKIVSGKILDDKGSPISGATVLVKGTPAGTKSNESGAFSISVPAGKKILLISYVGFTSMEISISDERINNMILTSATNTLGDVVVVGYGSAKKKDVTGAVTNVSSKDFNQGAITNPIQQIQGKVAGLVITTSTGDPNANPSIRLRGQTSLSGGQDPLIVVDGVPLDDVNQLSNIPPGDIATYDILKDASATSIFGSRGANGVILITTKKGRAGSVKVEYNSFVAVDKQAKYLDLLTGDEWRKANPAGVGSNYDNGANTDWQRAVTRAAYTHNHTLAISGGSKGFNYRGSVSYQNQEGIIINSGKQQVSVRFNAQQKALNDRLELNLGIISTQTNRKFVAPYTTERINGTSPALSVYNADGSYNAFNFSRGENNAVQGVDKMITKGTEYMAQIFGTIDYELFKHFKIGAFGTYTNFNSTGNEFFPKNIEGNERNRAKKSLSTRNNRRGDLHFNYLNSFGKHNVSATGVYEYYYYTNVGFNVQGENFAIPFFQDNNLTTGDPTYTLMNSSKEEFKLISFLGRVGYNYASKYYLTASIRQDGSSKFGKNNRWGYFPSAGIAWRISQEAFLKRVSWIDELKLRVGYGQTGNSDAITPYAAILTYAALPNTVFNPVTGTFITAYGPNQNANPNLRWERRIGRNIGMEFSLFNKRLTGDLNVFNDITENLLFDYTLPSPPFFILPPASGNPEAATVLANVGKLSNKGVELALNYRIIDKKDFSWSIGGQISSVRTRVETLAGKFAGFTIKDTIAIAGYSTDAQGSSTRPTTFLRSGYTPYVFYVGKFQGLDADGKQIVDSVKQYIDPSPRFNYAFTNNFRYKNWNLSVFFRGVSGQKAYNNGLAYLESGVPQRFARGYNTTRAALTNGITDGQALSDRWLENASFLRLDNASLGYTFQHVKGVQNLSVFIGCNNLFVITKYRGLDPEIGVAFANSAYISRDNSTPRTRSVSVGVNVTF